MYSTPKKNISEFFRQKSRHLQTGIHYLPVHKILLGGFISSHILFYLSLALFLIITGNFAAAVLIYGIRLALQYWVMNDAMDQLAVDDLKRVLPVLDLLYSIYFLTIVPLAILNRKQSWQ